MKKIAYKIFNPDMTCRWYKFEIGKTYTHEWEILLCESWFHYCDNPSNLFNYYSFDSNNIVCEVEILWEHIDWDDKSVTNKLKIIKKVEWSDVLNLIIICNKFWFNYLNIIG